MDNVFVISDRTTAIANGLFFTIAASIFLTFPLQVGGWPLWIFTITGCSIVWVPLWWHTFGIVYEIRLAQDGTVEIMRLQGSVAMPARAIRRVQGLRESNYGKDSWSMRILSDSGTFTVEFFGRAMELVNDLRALNPNLQVDGEWPVLNPWDPQLGGRLEA